MHSHNRRQRSFSRSRSRSRYRNRNQSNEDRYTIYALRLQKNLDRPRYYVGRTKKPIQQRVLEHQNPNYNGTSAAWCRLHSPLRLLEHHPQVRGRCTELIMTKQYMARYGIDNVRGACYVLPQLNPDHIKPLERDILEIRGQLDLCFQCGGGHKIKLCPWDRIVTARCSLYKQLNKYHPHSRINLLFPYYINDANFFQEYFGQCRYQNGKGYDIQPEFYVEFGEPVVQTDYAIVRNNLVQEIWIITHDRRTSLQKEHLRRIRDASQTPLRVYQIRMEDLLSTQISSNFRQKIKCVLDPNTRLEDDVVA